MPWRHHVNHPNLRRRAALLAGAALPTLIAAAIFRLL